MKIAIIEDEDFWREYARRAVLQYYSNEVEGCLKEVKIDVYKDGRSYLKSKEKYDISFVDIEMPVMDGFETIKRARKTNRDGIFIIMTTHIEMSRKGYLVNAFRYIDKSKLLPEISEALSAAGLVLGRNDKICINVIGDGKREVILKNIIYIETNKRNVGVHTKIGSYRCNDKLIELELALAGKWFFRSHNTYIVNLDEVLDIDNRKAVMSNGHRIDIAYRKTYEFKKVYMNRQFECANR